VAPKIRSALSGAPGFRVRNSTLYLSSGPQQRQSFEYDYATPFQMVVKRRVDVTTQGIATPASVC
jgi:hypothetical protein